MTLNSQDQESFKPLSLTYSAPPLIAKASEQVPEVSYNAFPEVNEKALDKSLSASPKSGKFNLPLNFAFNAYGRYENASMDVQLPLMTQVPIAPGLSDVFSLIHNFEMVHMRLAATEAKLIIRKSGLIPSYYLLEQWFWTDECVEVPLVPNPKGSELEKWWQLLHTAFSLTLLEDEVYSLFLGVARLEDKELRDTYEKAGVEAEEEEIKGFADQYYTFREAFEKRYGKLEHCRIKEERERWIENALRHAQMNYYYHHVGSSYKDTKLPPAYFPFDLLSELPKELLQTWSGNPFGIVPLILGLQSIQNEYSLRDNKFLRGIKFFR